MRRIPEFWNRYSLKRLQKKQNHSKTTVIFSSYKDKLNFFYILLCHRLTLGLFIFHFMEALFEDDKVAWSFLRYISDRKNQAPREINKQVDLQDKLNDLFNSYYQTWTKVEQQELTDLMKDTDLNDDFTLNEYSIREFTVEKRKQLYPDFQEKIELD